MQRARTGSLCIVFLPCAPLAIESIQAYMRGVADSFKNVVCSHENSPIYFAVVAIRVDAE